MAGRRGLQFGIDLALSSLLATAPMLLVLLLPRNPDGTLGRLTLAVPLIGLLLLAAAVLSWWYWSVLAARRGGRTPGMGWLGLRVVGPHGGAPGVGAMTLRWVGLLVDGILAGLVGLGFILATPRRQRFGDLLANTLVVADPPADRALATVDEDHTGANPAI